MEGKKLLEGQLKEDGEGENAWFLLFFF
jgi:hypothetical protein